MIEDDDSTDTEPFATATEALEYLRLAGHLDDAEIDIGEAALALALVFLSGVAPSRYRHHLKKIAAMTADEVARRTAQHADSDSLAGRADILRHVLHGQLGYKGDRETYDDIQNANLIRVIERRRGLPVALGILYMVAARAQGWTIDGLNFPGHFLLRLEREGERLILDPFDGGRDMTAADLRQLLKSVVGPRAELSHAYYEPVSTRGVLVRLQNNLKSRLIQKEEDAEAVRVAETIRLLDPGEYRILFDQGILYARIGEIAQAIERLEAYVAASPSARERDEARAILAELRRLRH